jgi:hypothetical protein
VFPVRYELISYINLLTDSVFKGLQILQMLIDAVRRKRVELWRNRLVIPHYDNAPAHSWLHVADLAGKDISAMDCPRHALDLAPTDIRLFQN